MHKKRRHTNILVKEAFVATALLCALVFVLSLFSFKFEFIRPIKQGLDGFDIYDLFYSGKGDAHKGERDTNIYIVQAGDTRLQIAQQIAEIESLQPAVLGIDLSFAEKKSPGIDSILTAAITGSSNIVQGFTLQPEEENGDLIKEDFLPRDYLARNGGYINFAHEDSVSIIRSYGPFYQNGEQKFEAFATRVVEKYSPEKFNRLKARAKGGELINYAGNIDYYTNYSIDEFEELCRTKQLEGIKGKIVLLGFFTKNDGSPRRLEDLRFSPLNDRISGRSIPDIYGVAIHANIITMVLNGHSYIHVVPLWVSYCLSFVLSFLFIWYILYLHKKSGHPTHIKLIAIQIPAIVLIVYILLKLYDWFNIKMALTPIFLLFVLSMEMLDLYIIAAVYLSKKFGYRTIFLHHQQH